MGVTSLARHKVSLDRFWLRDESIEDSANLPEPHLLAQEIADDLRSALAQIVMVMAIWSVAPRGVVVIVVPAADGLIAVLLTPCGWHGSLRPHAKKP